MELREKLDVLRQVAVPVSGMKKKTLKKLQQGSVVRIKGKNGGLFMVEEVLTYDEMDDKGNSEDFKWNEYKLRNLDDFSVRFLEVEDDDQIECYLTADKIAAGRFSQDPDKHVKKLTIDGMSHGTFYLEEFSHAVFTNAEGKTEHVLMLDYENDHDVMFGVEIWEDGNIEAFFYNEVKPSLIEVVNHG